MGNPCSKVDASATSKDRDFFIPGQGAVAYDEDDYDEGACAVEGNVYMVLCGCNYETPQCTQIGWGPIDQFISAQFVQKVVGICDHITDYRTVFQNDMTKENVVNAITEMASQVGPDDYFFLYYAGHGDQLADEDGDEGGARGDDGTFTGKDQAMVLLNPQSMNPEPRNRDVWLVDDELAKAITDHAQPGAKIVACLDCCHSGGMLDLELPCWAGFRAVSISGCASKQVSKGAGRGSFFSHSLSAAYEVLQNEWEDYPNNLGDQTLMTSQIYNEMVNQFNARYSAQSEQSLTIRFQGITPDKMPWPLIPNQTIGGEGSTGHFITYAAPPS